MLTRRAAQNSCHVEDELYGLGTPKDVSMEHAAEMKISSLLWDLEIIRGVHHSQELGLL
jgi:hypothetical protein